MSLQLTHNQGRDHLLGQYGLSVPFLKSLKAPLQIYFVMR